MATSWFQFNGGTGSPPELNPVNYSKIVSTSCTDGNQVCAVFAETQVINGIDRPVVSPLSSEISTALSTGKGSTNVKLLLV